MDGANQPTEFHFGHDELNALKCIFRARSVIEQQQDSGDDLYREEEKRHAAKVVPDRMAMKRHLFFFAILASEPIASRSSSHAVIEFTLTQSMTS